MRPWKFQEWLLLVLSFELLEYKHVGFLGELEDNLSLLFEMDWFIECVVFAFYTLSAKSSPNNCLESEWST